MLKTKPVASPFEARNKPWWAILITIFSTIVILRLEGRLWFCSCGNLRLWIGQAQSEHTSQHLLDPYSLTHFQHGLVLFFLVKWLTPAWNWPWQVWLAITLEAAWEIFENTPLVIDRYRTMTAALGYTGDTVINSFGDMLACAAGLLVAHRLGWQASCVLFFAIEAVLLLTIRDSLLVNVLMLILPLESLQEWQQK